MSIQRKLFIITYKKWLLSGLLRCGKRLRAQLSLQYTNARGPYREQSVPVTHFSVRQLRINGVVLWCRSRLRWARNVRIRQQFGCRGNLDSDELRSILVTPFGVGGVLGKDSPMWYDCIQKLSEKEPERRVRVLKSKTRGIDMQQLPQLLSGRVL